MKTRKHTATCSGGAAEATRSQERGCNQILSEGTNSARALTLDSQPPEPGQKELVLWQPPSLRPFDMTAPGNKYSATPGRSHRLGASAGEGHCWGPAQGPVLGGEEETPGAARAA